MIINVRIPDRGRGWTILGVFCVVLICWLTLRMAGYVQPKKCLSAVKTGFGRNGRQTKSSPERGGFGASWGLLLLFQCHIGTRKCSKFVVKCEKIVFFVVLRGISGLIQVVPWHTNSIFSIKENPHFRAPIVPRKQADCNCSQKTCEQFISTLMFRRQMKISTTADLIVDGCAYF